MLKRQYFLLLKLQKWNALLGPVMKSTGEVMGSDRTLEKALTKLF